MVEIDAGIDLFAEFEAEETEAAVELPAEAAEAAVDEPGEGEADEGFRKTEPAPGSYGLNSAIELEINEIEVFVFEEEASKDMLDVLKFGLEV